MSQRRADRWAIGMVAITAVLAISGCSSTRPSAAIDASPADSTPGAISSATTRPNFVRNRPEIPDELLVNKPEGRYIAPIPAISWDKEEGASIGAIVVVVDNGPKNGPLFSTAPYRSQLAVSASWKTVGAVTVSANWDRPYIADGPYRLRIGTVYASSPTRNYFGLGSDSMQPLNFPGAPGQTFARYSDYEAALQRERNGRAWSKYDKWDSQDFAFGASVERDVAGGVLRPFLGFQLTRTWVTDFTGHTVDAVDASGKKVEAIQNPTKLRTDCEGGAATGCDGGWDNFIRLGLTYDTRDFEPDPASGVHAQVAGHLAGGFIGSDFEYERATFYLAGYRQVVQRRRLIVAARGLYSMQSADVPFFSASTLAVNGFPMLGLGGFETLRGYKRERFVGRSAVAASLELRSSLSDGGYFLGQHLRPMVAAFVDGGRVYDDIELSFNGWRTGYGLGFRLAWNLSTIVAFDAARSGEETIFYMSLGHPF